MHKNVDLLFITLASPIQIGIYENKTLVQTITTEEKSSECLPTLFKQIQEKYEIKNIFYVNGPGSFMAIKVAYIFLKSISILKNIPLFATDAFYFNNNQPIKAIGKLFFVKLSSEIKTVPLDEAPEMVFKLPNVLKYEDFSTTTSPLYSIGAVG